MEARVLSCIDYGSVNGYIYEKYSTYCDGFTCNGSDLFQGVVVVT